MLGIRAGLFRLECLLSLKFVYISCYIVGSKLS